MDANDQPKFPYEHKYVRAPGGSLHYLHHPNPGRPALVGLHGFKDAARTFVFLEPLLLPNFELFLLDWPGHGDSERATTGYYEPARLMGDLIAFTGAIPPEKYYMMGHSMGAAFAARYAGLFPEEVLGLVLFEGFSGLIPPEAEERRLRSWAQEFRLAGKEGAPQRATKMRGAEDAERLLARIHNKLRPEQVRLMREYLTRMDEDGSCSWKHDPRLSELTIPLPFPPLLSRALWSRIESPVLLFFGGDSRLRPDEKAHRAGRELHEAKDAPESAIDEILRHFKNLEFHDIADAGHNIHHEKPDIAMSVMREFFKKRGMGVG